MLAGSCHCGAVRFRVDAPIAELTTCDCSLCVKRNAVMAKVPQEDLTVLEGEAMLTLYEWNTRVAKHYFCRRCGIYVFHRKRSAPDHFGVNVFCLEGFDAASGAERSHVIHADAVNPRGRRARCADRPLVPDDVQGLSAIRAWALRVAR